MKRSRKSAHACWFELSRKAPIQSHIFGSDRISLDPILIVGIAESTITKVWIEVGWPHVCQKTNGAMLLVLRRGHAARLASWRQAKDDPDATSILMPTVSISSAKEASLPPPSPLMETTPCRRGASAKSPVGPSVDETEAPDSDYAKLQQSGDIVMPKILFTDHPRKGEAVPIR